MHFGLHADQLLMPLSAAIGVLGDKATQARGTSFPRKSLIGREARRGEPVPVLEPVPLKAKMIGLLFTA